MSGHDLEKREYQRNWRRKRRELGRCCRCKGPAEVENGKVKSLCREHRLKNLSEQRAHARKCERLGVCRRCGAAVMEKEGKKLTLCRRHVLASRRYHADRVDGWRR